jgi:hypothetical protein
MRSDKQAHHCDVQNIQQWVSTEVVDQAVIGRRKMLLPGEASKVKTLEESAEAIVGFWKRAVIEKAEDSPKS